MKKILCFVCFIITLFPATQVAAEPTTTETFFLGSDTKYGTTEEELKTGITRWSLDTATGKMTQTGGPWRVLNPSYMLLSPDRKTLYTVRNHTDYQQESNGAISSLHIDPTTKDLTPINTVPADGTWPAFFTVDESQKFLLTLNYAGGNVLVHRIEENGAIGETTETIHHEGRSVNPDRQDGPRPHAITNGPNTNRYFVPDLGLDKIKTYTFDDKSGALTPQPNADVETPPGSGPRHLRFNAAGTYAYLTLELSSEVAAYRFDGKTLHEIGIYPLLPEDFAGHSTSAEVRITPNGKFVYASNRGHDSIAAFKVDPENGTLERTQIISTQGDTPRNFNIDPTGKILIVGNQHSNTLITFHINEKTGRLTPTGEQEEAPTPVFFAFL